MTDQDQPTARTSETSHSKSSTVFPLVAEYFKNTETVLHSREKVLYQNIEDNELVVVYMDFALFKTEEGAEVISETFSTLGSKNIVLRYKFNSPAC